MQTFTPATLAVPAGEVPQRPRVAARVSVVIANYNYGRYLPDAVRSALQQADAEVDVIIVDDASTDNSVAVATELAADPRVRFVRRDRNGGPVAAFNDGLALAEGEYLIRLDADDLLTPGSVARATALAEAVPSVGLVYGHPEHFVDGPVAALEHRDVATGWTVWRGLDWVELRCRLGHNCITSPEVLMRTSVVRAVGGMRDLAHTHDLEWWMRIARSSDVGWIAGADQAWHRVHGDSLSAREVDVIRDLDERAAAFQLLLTDGQGDPATDARLLALARDSLAGEAVARTTQAYAAGRGDSDETRAFLEYVSRVRGSTAGLARAGALDRALRLGRRRARYSPLLIALAVGHRRELARGRRRWQSTGL